MRLLATHYADRMRSPAPGARRAVRRALVTVGRAYRERTRTRVKILYELDVAVARNETGPFRLEPATPQLLERLHGAYPQEVDARKRDLLVARVEDPHEDCWVIVDDEEQLCGFACVAWTDHLIRRENHVVPVRPDEALLMDDYVVRAHRRRGAHGVSIARRLQIAAERGRTRGRVVIDERNTASQAVYGRLGARPVGRIITWPRHHRSIQLERFSPERLSTWWRHAR